MLFTVLRAFTSTAIHIEVDQYKLREIELYQANYDRSRCLPLHNNSLHHNGVQTALLDCWWRGTGTGADLLTQGWRVSPVPSDSHLANDIRR
jgi:hypothetical protein